jgi:putative membrane protein
MTNSSFRKLAAVAAAALALGGTAQAQSTPPGTPPPRTTPRTPGSTTTPRPAPAPATTPSAQQPTASSPGGSSGQLSADELRSKLAPLRARNAGYRDSGKVAAERGNHQQVKDLGRKMEKDYQKLDDDLKALGKERGVDVGEVSAADTSAKEGVLSQLRGLSGDQFDKEFLASMSRHLMDDVNSTKQMRDSTPGKDARVKKWLDDAENVMEDNLNQVRAAKVAIDRARGQARTPPKGS